MTEPVRLSKRVAELRGCSRREAEQLITGGCVRVDRIVIEEPQFRVTDQQIDIDAGADPAQLQPVTLLLHKPAGEEASAGTAPHLDTATLWTGDTSRIRPLKKHLAGLTACAPLEREASGLIVYTQDWRIVRKLTEDAATLEHEFVVEVRGELDAQGLQQMNRGMPGANSPRSAIKVSWQNETRLRVALKGARPGQIAQRCHAAGLEVVSMKRIRLGRVPLAQLPVGQWRYLRADERF